MNPLLLTADNVEFCADACARALQKNGAVLLVPTETVYGLICRADDAAAVDKIYQLKHREPAKQLAWFARDYAMALAAGLQPDVRFATLLDHFAPGPITVIGRNQQGGTIGFRFPDHPLIQALFLRIAFPLASTSANRSGRPNVLTAEAALAELDGEVDLAVDGGAIAPGAKASTVVSVAEAEVKIFRQGPVSDAAIFSALRGMELSNRK